MAVEERRRIALHRAAAVSWGEEVADTLVELVAPSGHELATRADIRGVLEAMAAMDEVCLSECNDRLEFHAASVGGQGVGLSRWFRW